jgi:DNA-binding GntR family transcriptional regulator
MTTKIAKSRKQAVAPSSKTRQVKTYEVIRKWILDGDLVPNQPLSEYRLGAELKVSRTPVREALQRLEHEGLVWSALNRGAFVKGLSVADIVEVYQVREQLEGFAASVAASEMLESVIEVLEGELERAEQLGAAGRVRETFDSDVHLHKQLIKCTKNTRLEAILATLDDQVHRIRVLSPKIPGRFEASLREHREILNCVKRRDGEGAQRAMVQHLRAARENAILIMMLPDDRQSGSNGQRRYESIMRDTN